MLNHSHFHPKRALSSQAPFLFFFSSLLSNPLGGRGSPIVTVFGGELAATLPVGIFEVTFGAGPPTASSTHGQRLDGVRSVGVRWLDGVHSIRVWRQGWVGSASKASAG
jgi:hypothetical protein